MERSEALREKIKQSMDSAIAGWASTSGYLDDDSDECGFSVGMLADAVLAVIDQEMEKRRAGFEEALDAYGIAEWERRYPARAEKDRRARELRAVVITAAGFAPTDAGTKEE